MGGSFENLSAMPLTIFVQWSQVPRGYSVIRTYGDVGPVRVCFHSGFLSQPEYLSLYDKQPAGVFFELMMRVLSVKSSL